ncbi:MAG: C1 family peptidase [Candidatus Eremiobacterota bacterium]
MLRKYIVSGLLAFSLATWGCGDQFQPLRATQPVAGGAGTAFPEGLGAEGLTLEEEAEFPKELDEEVADDEVQGKGVLPASAQVSNLPPVFNQGQVGSCGACAWGYVLGTTTSARSQGIVPASATQQTSPAFLYRKALFVQNPNNTTDCTGSTPTPYVQQLVRQGSPSMADVPYGTGSVLDDAMALCKLVFAVDLNAPRQFGFQAGSYAMLSSQGDELLKDIKEQVADGRPVGFAVNLTREFGSYKTGVYTANGDFEPNSGHAMVIVGYDDNKPFTDGSGQSGTGAFRCMNSWGTDWGEQGFFHMSYPAFLRSVQGYECVVLHPIVRQQLTASGSNLTPNPTTGPAAQISSAFQREGSDRSVTLVLNFYIDLPIDLTELTVTHNTGDATTQVFPKVPYRSGSLYFRRTDGNQFQAGAYTVTLKGDLQGLGSVTYTGNLNVDPAPNSTLPPATTDQQGESGALDQNLQPDPQPQP